MTRCAALAAAVAVTMTASSAAAQMLEDPADRLFGMCLECHTFKEGAAAGPVGPNLWGVWGRVAGTAPGFSYSFALRESKIVWTETNLDKFLQNPQAMVPGSIMDFALPPEAEREYVLEYLRNADPDGFLRALQAGRAQP